MASSREDIRRTRQERERFERRSIGPRWVSVLAMIPLGVIPIFGVDQTDGLARVINAVRDGTDLDHEAQWVIFKESDQLESEYLSAALEIKWSNQVEATLFFPISEHRVILGSVVESEQMMLATSKNYLEESIVVSNLPTSALKPALLALGPLDG